MIYVMSDIHGCDARYRDILRQIKLKSTDHLYILGDVIDRFPSGIGILRETMKKENITLLMGNHEHMMLEALTHPDDADARHLWYTNGGRITHAHFKHCSHAYRAEVLDYIRSLPVEIELTVADKQYLLVHGAPTATFSEGSRHTNSTKHAVWTRLGRNTPLLNDKRSSLGICPHTITHSIFRCPYGMAEIRSALTVAVLGVRKADLAACGWMICESSTLKKECSVCSNTH